MIVIENLFVRGSPFQWVFASALNRIDIDLVVSDGPDSLTFPDSDTDLFFTLHGSGLSVGPGGPFNGTASRVVITSLGAPGDSVDITLPTSTPFSDLVDTARAVPPGAPGDLDDFNRVLMPDDSPFPDLFFTGGDGPNVALGFGGNDVFDLGRGRDTALLTPGNDSIDGGPGKDTVSGEFLEHPILVDLRVRQAIADAGADSINAVLRRIENATGTPFDDTIKGNAKANVIKGGDGDDVLTGGKKGRNEIDGGNGDDDIKGGNGNDRIDGGSGDDTIRSGGGKDRVNGGAGDDQIFAQGGPNTIFGGSGKDEIFAGDKGDEVGGGGGKDTIHGGLGNDILSGGASQDKISGGLGDDIIDGGSHGDTLDGGAGNDTIKGGKGQDKIDGGSGDDTLEGGRGRDQLDGGRGNDTLNGGSGDDTLEGGFGDDILIGGRGRDTFYFRTFPDDRNDGTDRIVDFEAEKDIIHIRHGLTAGVSVKVKDGNTVVTYDGGKIIIEDQILDRDDITFEFGM